MRRLLVNWAVWFAVMLCTVSLRTLPSNVLAVGVPAVDGDTLRVALVSVGWYAAKNQARSFQIGPPSETPGSKRLYSSSG